jgi:hypothetical protein
VFGGAKNIFSGNYHNAALAANNTLYVWGDNSKNQIGLVSHFASTPTALNTLYYDFSWRIISAAASSGSHVTAIKSDGSLWSWGGNINGQLGDGTTINKSSPVQIGNSSWTTVSAGNSHTVAIDITGALYAWGLNTLGQLGDGTTINQSSPVQIGSSSWTSVSAGASYTAGIAITSSLFTWGINSAGQLGDGTTINQSSPVQIGTSSWTTISSGFGTTAAIDITGALFTWGSGTLGQLGTSQLGAQQNIINLQSQAGAQQQAQEQQKINQSIQDYATAQQYPYMQLGIMNSMLRGLPLQSSTTQMYQAQPSTGQQLMGYGLGALGAYKAFG